MADLYKGDTFAKKLGRAWFWVVVHQFLGDRFFSGKHLVFASREGGDVAVLKALGVKGRQIIAVEREPEAAAQFATHHPDVPVLVGDVADLVSRKGIRGELVSAHLDFCGWFTSSAARTAARVIRFGMQDRSLFSVGILKGREQGEALQLLKDFKDGKDLQWGIAPLARMKPWGAGNRLTRFDLENRNSAEMRAWFNRKCSSEPRRAIVSTGIQAELAKPGPAVGLYPVSYVSYDSGATPIMYISNMVVRSFSESALSRTMRRLCKDAIELLSGRSIEAIHAAEDRGDRTAYYRNSEDYIREVGGFSLMELWDMRMGRSGADGFLRMHPFYSMHGKRIMDEPVEFGEGSVRLAVTLAEVIDQLCGRGLAAGVLTVRPARLAAWRAHVTRGTYSEVA